MITEMKMRYQVLLWVICICFFYPSTAADRCGDPPKVSNADANLQNFTIPVLNGTVVYYTCHYGYAINSSVDPSATCIIRNDALGWQLSAFSCEPACESVPEILHGTLRLEGREPPFFTGDSVLYSCDNGYTAEVSYPKIICKNGSWILPQEACRARSCGYPGDIENSRRIGNLFNFPNNVTYICEEGFLLKGAASVFCTPTGAWQPQLPSCQAVVCPLLSELENGKVISSNRRYKAVASYECNRHFHLQGSAQRVCQADATWDGSAPTCVEVICPNPGPLPYGRVLPERPVYKAGDVVVFSCNKGGKKEASKCLEDGTWKLSPPVCEVETVLEFKKNTSAVDGHLVTTGTYPSTVTAVQSKVTSCDDPGEIRNGKKVITGFSVGHNVTYSCEENYEIRGQRTLICLPTGKWNVEKLPLCVKPIPVVTIVSIVIGVLIFISIAVAGYFFYRWREKKLHGYGKKSKALTADAADLDEITGLDKEKKPIPVTVL